MALDKSTLKASIKTALNSAVGTDDNADQVSQDIADAIDVFVKSGTVTTAVVGTLPAGPVAASGSGGIT